MAHPRQIFLQGPLGQRQFREVLGGLFAGFILAPENFWLVSAWITDFPVLDNGSGTWSVLEPAWGNRTIWFGEILAKAIDEGCDVGLVTRDDERCHRFTQALKARLLRPEGLQVVIHPDIHIKGLLTKRFFLEGSMNFTFSGSNNNDEYVVLNQDEDMIRQAFFQFRDRYFRDGAL